MSKLITGVYLVCLIFSPISYAQGNWGSQFVITTDSSQAWHNDFDTEVTHRALFSATLDSQWDNWYGALNWQAFRGTDGSMLSQDYQGISNIDAAHFNKLYEAYLQYSIRDTRVKCGQVDANTEFAVIDSAASFISPSAGKTATIVPMPTYPLPSLSCNVLYQPLSGVQAMFGVYAGAGHRDFSSQFKIGELAYSFSRGRMALGAWQHSGQFTLTQDQAATPTTQTGTQGWYSQFEWDISEPLTLFAGYSHITSPIDTISQHHLLGGRYLPNWADWQWGNWPIHSTELGLLFSQARLIHGRETGIEAFIQLNLSPHLWLQPVVQYIHHANATEHSGWVTSLRINWQWANDH